MPLAAGHLMWLQTNRIDTMQTIHGKMCHICFPCVSINAWKTHGFHLIIIRRKSCIYPMHGKRMWHIWPYTMLRNAAQCCAMLSWTTSAAVYLSMPAHALVCSSTTLANIPDSCARIYSLMPALVLVVSFPCLLALLKLIGYIFSTINCGLRFFLNMLVALIIRTCSKSPENCQL